MLDRFVPVAGMLLPADITVSRSRMLEAQHRAELRLTDHRRSLPGRLATAIGRARALVAPAPVACPGGACPAA